MEYRYHYCAQWQPAIGQISYVDGVLTCQKPIDSQERYREVKKAISPEHHQILVITALTPLVD